MSVLLDRPPADTAPESTDESIEARLQVVGGHLNVLHAQLVALTAEAIATGAWDQPGVRSVAHWLIWQAGLSPSTANDIVRLADATGSHPAILGRLGEGVVSIDQAAAAARAPAYLDETFAEHAEVATVPQLRVLARAANNGPRRTDEAKPAADGETDSEEAAGRPDPAQPEREEESLSWWFDESGRLHLHGELDADHGRLLEAALVEARDALFHAGRPDVTWVEALVELARRSLAGLSVERDLRFRVNWFVDPTEPVPARWIDGIPIPVWLAEMLGCDGLVSPVYVDGARPLSVGRTVTTIPERTRRLVVHRDRACRLPGCGATRWLQVHHIRHQEHGGGHDTANLLALCGYHHRLHHRGLLGITGDADKPGGVVFTDRHGRPIRRPTPTPPSGPPPSPASPYQHPLGEPLQRRAVCYPDPPPNWN